MTKAPASLETPRLMLRRAELADAEAVFERYASDEEVGRYMAWPRHTSVDMTRRFIEWSDQQWASSPAGPYLIFDKAMGSLIGGTGMVYEGPDVAAVGYVLARDAWGRGYASEALSAMIGIATELSLRRLYAICHIDHRASQLVLEKAGFVREPPSERTVLFPNLSDEPQRVASYVWPSR
jgi:RimJ/RimL family protein N-acetyltransferase